MDAFAVLTAPVTTSLYSGMLSERCICLAIARGLETDESSLSSLFIVLLLLYQIRYCVFYGKGGRCENAIQNSVYLKIPVYVLRIQKQ